MLFADGISTEEESCREIERLQRELQQVRLQIELLLGALQVEGEVRSVVKRVRELEEREREIQYRLASLEASHRRLSVDDIRNTLRQFASAWEAMTEAERHEVVSLVVQSVRVRRKDAFDVLLNVPGSNIWEEWLPTSSSVRIDAKVVDIPNEGICVAELRLC
jgi:chromosome segregation ATPase